MGVAVGEGRVEETPSVACRFDPNGPDGAFLTQEAPSGGLPNTTAYGRGSLFAECRAIKVTLLTGVEQR